MSSILNDIQSFVSAQFSRVELPPLEHRGVPIGKKFYFPPDEELDSIIEELKYSALDGQRWKLISGKSNTKPFGGNDIVFRKYLTCEHAVR